MLSQRFKTNHLIRLIPLVRSVCLVYPNNQGQISLMVGSMMVTFFLMLAFVINTGMIVNAKINLQNAADLAVYAGAAAQARQLNNISFLNYEMRRQWKKFLFRIYVIGNMAQDQFPKNGKKSGPMQYIPNKNSAINYGTPATCIAFSNSDNFCHLSSQPAIAIPPTSAGGMDSINDTLVNQLQALESIREDNCKLIGYTNKTLNMLWLFNSDPELSQLTQTPTGGAPPNSAMIAAVNTIKQYALGLGVIPRELILGLRIQSLAKIVNAPAQQAVTFQSVKNLDPLTYERTLLAYLSAYNTLGNHVFGSTEDIQMTELLPDQLLSLIPVSTDLDVSAVEFADILTSPPGECNWNIATLNIRGNSQGGEGAVPVGVYKDPTYLTYYAIRLDAKAKILFWPFQSSGLSFRAYAAAQPFGSRIGPNEAQLNGGFSTNVGSKTVQNTGGPGISISTGLQPNLAMRVPDSSAQGQGWDTLDVLSVMYQFLAGDNSGLISTNTANQAYQAAMSPNPAETGLYNIPNGNGDSFMKNFVPSQNGNGSSYAVIQAAIDPSALTTEIQNLFSSMTISDQGGFDASALETAITTGLNTYINSLSNSGQGGEDGETIALAQIQDPFGMTGSPSTILANNSQLFLTENNSDPQTFKTSWDQIRNTSLQAEGRTGYSVKFISLSSLIHGTIQTSNSQNASMMQNMPNDPILMGDLFSSSTQVQH